MYCSPTSFPNRDKETEFQAATDCKICPFDCLIFPPCICILLFLCFMTRNPNFGAIQLGEKCALQYRLYKDSVSLSDYGTLQYFNNPIIVLPFWYASFPQIFWRCMNCRHRRNKWHRQPRPRWVWRAPSAKRDLRSSEGPLEAAHAACCSQAEHLTSCPPGESEHLGGCRPLRSWQEIGLPAQS